MGHWWKNGKALEPKWRDGDSVPLIPFHAISKHRSSPKERLQLEVLVPSQKFYSNNVSNQAASTVNLSRRRKPPQLPEDEVREVKTRDENGRKIEDSLTYKKTQGLLNRDSKFSGELRIPVSEVAMKYRETFQNQPNEYEMNDEEYQKPRPRKRRPPQNDEFTEARMSYPYYQPVRPTALTSNSNADLKILLKKQQGQSLSLSEILQRSNLTLPDLLQGKVSVVDLLKGMKDEELEGFRQGGSEKIELQNLKEPYGKEELQYKLFEPESKFQKEENETLELPKPAESGMVIPHKEIEVKNKDSKIMMSEKMAISENPVRVSTTMKNPESSPVNKPEKVDIEDDEIMEFSDFNMQSSTEDTTLQVEQVINPEFENEEIEEATTQLSEPESTTKSVPVEITSSAPVSQRYELKLGNISNHLLKLEPNARAEILELLSSGPSAKRLERLLESRNMTLEEFIALRQRGSSQVHLAEVSKHRMQKSHVQVQTTTTKPETTSKITTKITTTTVPTSTEEIRDNVADEQRVSEHEKEVPDEAREIFNIFTAFDTVPFETQPDEEKKNGSMAVVEVGRVEEILDESGTLSEVFKTVESDVEEAAFFSRMTPSIIASGAILGVTLLVFAMIFFVCRTQQKQKYTYRNTFSRSVFQSPAMAARKLSNSSSLNTIMVNVVATSTAKKPERHLDIESDYDVKSDIENDSLDGNDSWDTIPDFMK